MEERGWGVGVGVGVTPAPLGVLKNPPVGTCDLGTMGAAVPGDTGLASSSIFSIFEKKNNLFA